MINSPLYRIEHFLDAWLNGTTPPEPLHPIEFFIAKLCGADVVTPEPISRADKYLAKLLGEDIEIPKPQARMDFYLAAMCGEDVEIPEPLYRIEYWLAQLANSGELKTVSGNPISVSDALARPAESLVIEILPSQDLHGYANPWPAGGGKNKLKVLYPGRTNNDVTFTTSADGSSVSLSGTASSAAYFASNYGFQTDYMVKLPSGTYTLSGENSSSNVRIYGSVYDTSGTSFGTIPADTGSGTTFTFSEEFWFSLQILVVSGTNVDGVTIKPQIESGSPKTAWTPYSNICPITGHDSVKVTRTGKNLCSSALGRYNWVSGVRYNNTSGPYCATADKFAVKGGENYIVSFDNSASTNSVYVSWFNGDTYLSNSNVYSAPYSVTAPSDTTQCAITIRNTANYEGDPTVSNLQLELGSTATAYEPYQGTTYSISWQDSAGTVYGGSLDVTTGVLTVDRAKTTVGALSWSLYNTAFYASIQTGTNERPISPQYKSEPSVSSMGEASGWTDYSIRAHTSGLYLYIKDSRYSTASAFKTAEADTEIVYELATPLTIQLTPTQVDMLLGNNVIWNDVGDMTLEYLADGPADDIDALQILLNNRYVNNGEPDEATDKEALEILLGGNTR